jgi:hypothetical protein
MVIPFDGQAAYVGRTSQGCSVQQGHKDLLQAGRGEVQHCCRPDAFSSVLRITAGQVRDHYRIPVILGRRGPQYLSALVAIELSIRGTFLGPFETPAA